MWGEQTCILLRKAENIYVFNSFALQGVILVIMTETLVT